MNGSDAAHRYWEQYSDYISESYMDDVAWESFLEEAIEHEKFTDEDGEWLPEYDTHDKLMQTQECKDYTQEFISTLIEIQDECSYLEHDCGGCLYAYHGVSRSDFA